MSSYVPKLDRVGEDVVLTYLITATVTTGAVTDISTVTDSFNGETFTQHIMGKSLKVVEAYPTAGGTAPDAADVTVKQNGLDLLGGFGVNLIHATATKSTYPRIDGQAVTYPIKDTLTIGVTNNIASLANFTIRLTFI